MAVPIKRRDGFRRGDISGVARPPGDQLGSQVNVAVQTNGNLDLSNLAKRLIKR